MFAAGLLFRSSMTCVDMRAGRAAIPLSGHLFCFCGRRGDLLKVIWHDARAKKLERGRFVWPSLADGVVSIS